MTHFLKLKGKAEFRRRWSSNTVYFLQTHKTSSERFGKTLTAILTAIKNTDICLGLSHQN